MAQHRSTPITHDEARDVRAAYLREQTLSRAAAKDPYAQEVDTVIDILMLNRDHIGALAVVVLAHEGDAVVNPTGSASDGFSAATAINSHLSRLSATFLRSLADRADAAGNRRKETPDPADFLRSLFGND